MSTRTTQRLLLAAALLAAACAGGLPTPTSSDAGRAAARWPGATLAELEQGRSLYVSSCAGCHGLKEPSAVRPNQWRIEIAEMRASQGVELTDREAALMERYLWTMASRSAASR